MSCVAALLHDVVWHSTNTAVGGTSGEARNSLDH